MKRNGISLQNTKWIIGRKKHVYTFFCFNLSSHALFKVKTYCINLENTKYS